jgi:hypothetical protein
MSKQNKANKSNYIQAGRLSPDDMARERQKQAEVSSHAKGKERVTAKADPGAPASTPRRTGREE